MVPLAQLRLCQLKDCHSLGVVGFVPSDIVYGLFIFLSEHEIHALRSRLCHRLQDISLP